MLNPHHSLKKQPWRSHSEEYQGCYCMKMTEHTSCSTQGGRRSRIRPSKLKLERNRCWLNIMKVLLTSKDRKQLNKWLVRWAATCQLHCPNQHWMIVHWRYCRLADPIGSHELCISTSLCYLKLNEFKVQLLNHSSCSSSPNSSSHEWPTATILDSTCVERPTSQKAPWSSAWKGMFCAMFWIWLLGKGQSRKPGAGNPKKLR